MSGRCLWHSGAERRLYPWNLKAKMRGKRKPVFPRMRPSPLMQLGYVLLISAVHQTFLNFCPPGSRKDDISWLHCGYMTSSGPELCIIWGWNISLLIKWSSNTLFSRKRLPHSLGSWVRNQTKESEHLAEPWWIGNTGKKQAFKAFRLFI